MYWELSQKDFVFQKCSLVSVSETSFKEMKQRKKEENFTVVFPYFFNLNLNYEKISLIPQHYYKIFFLST